MDLSPLEIQAILSENEVILGAKKLSKLPAKELIVLKFIFAAMEQADLARLNFLLDRTIGKVEDNLNIKAMVVNKTLHEQIVDIIEADENNK